MLLSSTREAGRGKSASCLSVSTNCERGDIVAHVTLDAEACRSDARGGQLVNVEPFLKGAYIKHNDNVVRACRVQP